MGVTSTVSWITCCLLVCMAGSHVWCGAYQYWGITAGCPVSIPVYFSLLGKEVLWWHCSVMQGKNLLNVSKTKKCWLAPRGELQVLGCSLEWQTWLEDQHWCCVWAGNEQTLLSEEAQCVARALFTLQLTAGWTASVPEMAAGSTGPLARIWRRLNQWETGGHWTNRSPPCPITPAPLHTAEAAELILPQTCSTSLNEERFRKSFLLFSVKLHNRSVFLCQVNTPVRTATHLLWFILHILLINGIWSSHNLSLNFVFFNLASILSS